MKKHLHVLIAWMLIVMLLVSNTVNVMAVEPVTGGRTGVSSELTQSTEMDDDALTEETETESEVATETEEESTTPAAEESTEGASEEESTAENSAETSAAEEDNAAASATTAKAEETATEPSENAPEAETTAAAENKAVSTASDITKDEEINPNGDYLYELSATSTDGKVIVTASMDESAGIETGTTINAEPITGARLSYVLRMAGEAAGVEKDNAYGFAYDVYLLKNGKRVEPNESIHICMQYTEPMTIDIPKGSEIQSLQLCHIHNKDVEILDSAIDAEDNAVNAAEFDLSSFSPLVTLASVEMGTTGSSSDLKDFLSGDSAVTISGVEKNSDGKYVVRPGAEFKVKLTAKEKSGLQFDNTALTYTLPEGFEAVTLGGTTDIDIQDDGVTYKVEGNTWEIKDGVLTFTWNKNSANYDKLEAAANVSFWIQMDGKLSQNATSIQWSTGCETEFAIDTSNYVVVNKECNGSQSSDNDKSIVQFKVTVKSAGESQNVVVTDTITGTAMKLIQDSVTVSSDKVSSVSVTENTKSDTGFTYTFASMQDGETITITYKAKVDFSKVSGKTSFELTGNKVSAKSDGMTEPSKKEDVYYNYDTTTKLKKEKKSVSSDVDANGYRTVSWQITYNDACAKSMAGHTITDTIDTASQSIMDYSGDVTIQVYGADGKQVGEARTFTPTVSEKSWSYTIPSKDTAAYKYVFTYNTKVNVSGLSVDANVKNHAEDNQDGKAKDDGEATVKPADNSKVKLEKKVKSVSSTEVTWKITMTVPAGGLNQAVLTDIYPTAQSKDGTTYQDTFKDESIYVTGLQTDEAYKTDITDNKQCVITFYKDSAKTNQGLNESTDGKTREITVTLTTNVDKGWYNAAGSNSDLYNHKNNAEFNYGSTDILKKNATAKVMAANIRKSDEWSSDTEDGLPQHKYTIKVGGVTSRTFEISDTFEKAYFKCVVLNDAAVYCGNKTVGSYVFDEENQKFTVELNDDPGIDDYYEIKYVLQVKDKEALKELQKKALKLNSNQGAYQIKNTASFGTAQVTNDSWWYNPNILTKQLLTSDDDLKTNKKAEYKIVVNPGAAQLNGGQDMELVDEYSTNQNIDPDSISIVTDPADHKCTYRLENGKLTFTIPDSTSAMITYSAIFGGNGQIQLTNKAKLKNSYESEQINKQVQINSGGAGSIYSIKVSKRDAEDESIKLAGAEFELYKQGESGQADTPVTDKNNKAVKYTTNNEGSFTVKGSQATDGWALDDESTYYLKETKAPNDYQLNSDDEANKYYFKIGESSNEENHIYLNGGYMTITNKKKPEVKTTSIGVKKVWDNANNQDGKRPTSVKVKLSASVDGEKVDSITDKDGTAIEAEKTLNADSWTASWSNLPKTDTNGNNISYTVKESGESNGKVSIDGASYNVSYSGMTASADGKSYSITITNTYVPETVPETEPETETTTVPETETTTVPETTRSNGGNGGGSGGGGGGEWHAVTTAPEVTTAPSTEETTTAEGGNVNGDSRAGEVETNPDGSVKGAGRGRNGNGDDGDVNGAKRGPLTGDQAMTLLWGAGFMCCAILLFAWVRRRKR